MLSFNINLTSLAVILWSGMLIISGSIWVLSSQVRKLADLLEEGSRMPARVDVPAGLVGRATSSSARVANRGASVRVRSAVRSSPAGSRGPDQLVARRRPASLVGRTAFSQEMADRPDS